MQLEITSFAVRPLGFSGPVTDTAELVKPQPGRASVLFGHAFNAGIKDIADRGVRMSVESVQPRAEIIGTFGRLWKRKIVQLSLVTTTTSKFIALILAYLLGWGRAAAAAAKAVK